MEFFEHPLLHYPDLMLALLRAGCGAEADLGDALAQIERDLAGAHERPPVTRDEALARLAAARRHLAAAGLVEDRPDGRYATPDRGRRALRDHPDGIDDTVLMRFPEFRSYMRRRAAHAEPEDAAGEPFRDGYAAFQAGRPHFGNPHRQDTAAHLAWENGWFAARDEARAHPTPEEKYGGAH